jgi:hypothetical protein
MVECTAEEWQRTLFLCLVVQTELCVHGAWILLFLNAVYESGYLRSNVCPCPPLFCAPTPASFATVISSSFLPGLHSGDSSLRPRPCHSVDVLITLCPSEYRDILKWTGIMLDTVHCLRYRGLYLVSVALWGLSMLSMSSCWPSSSRQAPFICMRVRKTNSDRRLSVRLNGTARLLSDGFSRNFVFGILNKIC